VREKRVSSRIRRRERRGRRGTHRVHPVDRDVKDPDTVEVDEEVEERTAFEVRLEERLLPLNLVKLHEALGSGDVNETSL
jgi:hypothetical protein